MDRLSLLGNSRFPCTPRHFFGALTLPDVTASVPILFFVSSLELRPPAVYQMERGTPTRRI